MLLDARFESVEVHVEANMFRYADLQQYWQNARGTGLSRRLAALDAEQTERVRAALAERVRPQQTSTAIHLEASALLAIGTR